MLLEASWSFWRSTSGAHCEQSFSWPLATPFGVQHLAKSAETEFGVFGGFGVFGILEGGPGDAITVGTVRLVAMPKAASQRHLTLPLFFFGGGGLLDTTQLLGSD